LAYRCRNCEESVVKVYLLIAAAVVALFTLTCPTPAAAAFTVCNNSTYGRVNVAYAVKWHASDGSSYGESQGWWLIDQDACKIIMTNDISAYTIYIYAYADADPSTEWWGGTYKYCLDPEHKFLYHGDDMSTPCSNGRSFGMRFIDTGTESTYTYYLRD
jgi:uncharacterized membrane protein